MSFFSKNKGKKGEDIALNFLLKKGYKLLKRNFHFGREGEIDLICRDKDCIVFVEVKYRSNLDFGEPEASITQGKIKQLRKIAEAYLYVNKIENTECRFDVIAIYEKDSGETELKHYPDAF